MRVLLCTFPLLLSACASAQNYEAYTQAVALQNASRTQALAAIAQGGGETSRAIAALALALGAGQTQITPPQNEALQWASVILPSITSMYGIRANAVASMRSSDNAMLTSVATTNGFVELGKAIQAPVVSSPVVTTPQANVTYTLSGQGVLGSGTFSTDQHNISSSYNPTTTTPVFTTGP